MNTLEDEVSAMLFDRTIRTGIKKSPFYKFGYNVYWQEESIIDDLNNSEEIFTRYPFPLYIKNLKRLKDKLEDDMKTYKNDDKTPWYKRWREK